MYIQVGTPREDDIDWTDILSEQVRSRSVCKCPNDHKSTNICFGVNGDVFQDYTAADEIGPRRLTEVRHPSNIIMMGDVGCEDDFVTARPDALIMLVRMIPWGLSRMTPIHPRSAEYAPRAKANSYQFMPNAGLCQ